MSRIPNFRTLGILSNFQMNHVGTTVTGMSGILPFTHVGPPPMLQPNIAKIAMPQPKL